MEVERIVRTHVSTDDLTPPQELVQAINNGQTQLLQIVKALGEYLTSTEDDTRLKGLTFLSNLLGVVNPGKINRQATTVLTSFYLSKLDDFDSLPPALSGLTVLSKLSTFDGSAAVDVYKGIVENVNLKAYVQATRHMVYVLLDSLIGLHREEFKKMGTAFINSYTKTVDGEKDPRNLMLLFSIDRVILLEFDVRDHIEDFFDVTFCYFPITFRPPPNDPYGITADDLKVALRGCLAASPYFAKMALPLFLEKFATATGATMKDLLQSMAACFPTYGAEAVGERGKELWEGIKTEILYSSDASIEAASLSALESLMRTLYPTSSDVPSGLAQDIIKECQKILEEPDKSQAMGATKIIAAIFRGSPSAGKFALSQILPQLFRSFNSPSLPSHRSPILSSISSILYACQSTYSSSQRSHAEEQVLEPYRSDLIDVLREGLRTEGLKSPAIKGCVALVGLEGYWSRLEVEDVVRGMDDILVNDENPEIRPEVITALTTISKSHAAVIESLTLPLLFHNLPETAPSVDEREARERYRSILGSLSKLCTQPALWQTMIIRITNKLDYLASAPLQSNTDVSMDGSDGESARECGIAYAWDLLNTLLRVIDTKVKEKHVDVGKYYEELMPRLFGLVMGGAQVKVGGGNALFMDRRLVEIVGKIGERLLWDLSAEKQEKQFALIYSAFERGEIGGIVSDSSNVQSLSPLRLGASSSEQDLISLYSSLLQGLNPSTSLPSITSSAEYLGSKIHWTINIAKDMWQVRWGLEMICAYVNKKEGDLKETLEVILEKVWNEAQDTTREFEIRRRGLLVYLHIIKALSLLRQPLAYTALEKVIDVLSLFSMDPLFVEASAKAFGVLARKGDGHLTGKLLYAQKLWNFALPKLVQCDKDASGRERIVYLVAFASLLPLVPASLCLSDLPTILPLIQRSLSLASPTQRTNAILTLTSILETPSSPTTDSLIHSSAPTLVSSLISSSIPQSGVPTSARVREVALGCLSAVPEVIRYEVLHKEKAVVVKELGRAVDDASREVRKEAVECRAKWYRYGQAT
ncbi:DNA repair/transcription protein MET18/MMS19 [Cryptococcus wingfieldii CBS 7118]|uniref:MMS19 nucleotide excision repair protein n=1 Tax=Cryptococcus wingfieldii CBS 7118 TaxID=1295528 RepID=A0A1E3JKJ2_9TREE|nr:DNA repair/transcription protein MET18/MMS19 [Cryptococcus wingfieldii CBS 7118]ODO00637.1 DNA repair/transcription protein MET18/MMS19 [Cryptococcus wingfieldii CBS 7118]